MKVLIFTVIVVGLLTLTASAQNAESSVDPGLKIVRVELQRAVVKSPGLRAVASTNPAAQAQARADRAGDGSPDSNPALHRMSTNAEIAPKSSKHDPLGDMPSPGSIIFVAAVLVKNVGTKTITATQWEYLLFEKDGTEPIKRYRVETKKTIAAGEQAELTKEVTPKGKEQQARIVRIQYSDGTFWRQK